jgi:HD-GYP domain-containing protein (c-di-GMP phosphodiesterase class II)
MSSPAAGIPATADLDARKRPRLPFHIYLGVLIGALVVAAMAGLGAYSFYQMKRVTLGDSERLFEQIARQTATEVGSADNQVALTIDLLARQPVVAAQTLDERLVGLPFFREALKSNASVSAIYVGYGNGDFFLVRPLTSAILKNQFKAPENAAYMVQSVERQKDGTTVDVYAFFDEALFAIERRRESQSNFDPRKRVWYQAAIATTDMVRTPPYLFFMSKEVGVTMARKAPTQAAVLGADMTLLDLSVALSQVPITHSAQLALYKQNGAVLAYMDPVLLASPGPDGTVGIRHIKALGQPALTDLAILAATGKLGQLVEYRVGERDWIGRVTPIGQGNSLVLLAQTAPRDELLEEANRIRRNSFLFTGLGIVAAVMVASLLAIVLSRQLRRLSAAALAIRSFDFERPVGVHSLVTEIDNLAEAMEAMKNTIAKFLEIGRALGKERDLMALMRRILEETTTIFEAEGGIIYLIDDEGRYLRPESVHGVRGGAMIDLLPIVDLASEGEGGYLPAAASRAHEVLRLETRAKDPRVAGLGLNPMLQLRDEDHVVLIAVPLYDRRTQPLGVLLLIDIGDQAASMSEQRLAFAQAISGLAAITIENRRLLQAQKDLFNSLTRLIANAIDAKSRYTGGHCLRVPILTRMLCEAAVAAEAGPLRDFALSAEEWEAVDLASWLHDCGKVTTPEYVVDKATKLETVYDRIHEIRMRFEVLKRDAEIAYWKGLAEGTDPERARAGLDAALAELDEEFRLVATTNEGAEFTSPEAVAKLTKIAGRRWLRTLDDRIGISREERDRKERRPAPDLPVWEPLLADKDEHLVMWEPEEELASDNQWGIKMAVPAYKYNRGEIYNLSIDRGTLTKEERFKINDHIIQTIILLESLPYPKHLRRVPEIAGGHHEKMDGTGYPKRLRGASMSVPARIMAIADVFEALTARDRPYKPAKSLSSAIRIIGSMKRNRHLDPDLVDLFLTSGVWRHYAERFLAAEQIDEPDIAAVLAIRPEPAAV